MPKVHTNHIDIYYEVTGSGKPLLLISGLGYGLWQWHKMVPLLAEHFQVITFDNCGAGQTDKPPGPYTAQMLAADTAGLLDELGIASAMVLGHSMGGFIAQELALSRPDLITKLLLASTNFGGPNCIPITPEALAVLTDRSGDPVDVVRRGAAVAFAPGFSEEHPEILEELTAYRLTNPVPPDAYQAQMAIGLALVEEDKCFEPRLKHIKAPTIVIAGEHDRVVPPGNAELIASKITGSRVVIMPGVGHLFPIEAPEAAARMLVNLLKS